MRALAGTAGSRNHVMQINHMGLYPEVRRGDYVIWQDVQGFVQDGLYITQTGDVEQVYLVQNCSGRLRLLWPERDVDAKTGRIKPDAEPQECTPVEFSACCRGFVVASVKIDHEAAFKGNEVLQAREFRAPRKALHHT